MNALARYIKSGVAAGAAIVLLAIAGGAAAQVTVRMPHITVAPGSAVSVPVYLVNVGVEEIAAVEVSLAYDPDQISFQGTRFLDPSSQPTLLASWLVDLTGSLEGLGTYLDSSRVTAAPLDTLKIAAATGISSADRLAADGVLFYVDFTVALELEGVLTIPLDLTHVLLDDAVPNVEDGSISVTGTDGTIQVAPAMLASNQAIQVTVEDIDEDRTAGPDDILVQVTNGTQTEVLSAYETGDTGGVFVGSIGAVFSASPTSGDDVVQVAQGNVITFCYDDQLDASGGSAQRCGNTTVEGGTLGGIDATVAAQPADLVRIRVVDPDLNADPASKDTVSVTVTTVSPVDGQKDQETILLEEVDIDVDILFGQFAVVQGAGAGSDGDVNAQRADTLFITYEDVATGTGVGALLQDTCIVVDPWGDASGDGKLRGFDASQILFHAVDIGPPLSGLDSLAANVDSLAPFGPINEFDASLVLQMRVGLIDHFPVQEKTALDHPQPESGQSAPKQIVVERIVALEEEPGHLALIAEERTGIVAGELVVSGFSGRAAMADGLGDFLVVSARGDQGTRILFAGARGTTGPGALVRLFPAAGDRVELVRVNFNGGGIVGLPSVRRAASLPVRFALEPNAPNPFNPETLIRYALPGASRVRLEIFNIAGQRVRTLVEEQQPAGTHSAVWDGRDTEGRQAAGGVYFYRLTAGGGEAVRRMVLVK